MVFTIGNIGIFSSIWGPMTDTYTPEVVARGFIALVGLAVISIIASYGFLSHAPLVYLVLLVGVVALIAPMIMWRCYE